MQKAAASSTYDVIVVGSGASGGWAAKRLAEAGVKVALLDAGRVLKPEEYKEHSPAFSLKYRNQARDLIRRSRPVQTQLGSCNEWNYEWFRNDLEEPYTTEKGKPFSWQGRMQVVGGRTNVWGRQSYRMSDLDFKAASHDGFGVDWHMRAKVKQKLGWTVTLGRSANITKPINGRQPCHYCGPCERGCVTKSYFNSAFTTVADALASGNCTLVPNAMVYKVLVDPGTHRARGVVYVDRETRQAKEVHARAVVLSAQALESVRILLNSKSEQDPAGLANSSGA